MFEATYPFHPVVLSVFERKWQALPQFQRTRGVLKMLALWVSKAYSSGFAGVYREPLISLGSAPLEDSLFRVQVFDQLGQNLEAAVTSDIAGREAHAVRLDAESTESIKSSRLHRKVASTIFFESSGGEVRQFATEPEIRLGVSDPDLEISDVETVLENLANECYHLTGEGKKYWISPSPNLNKLLADRKATIDHSEIDKKVLEEVDGVFSKGTGIDKVFFPKNSGDISDKPILSLVIIDPNFPWINDTDPTAKLLNEMVTQHGPSGRTYKSGLIFAVSDSGNSMAEDARKLLAWEAIRKESDLLRLNESQQSYLKEQLSSTQRDLKESVWRAYKNVLFLDKGGDLKRIDMGLLHSSAADSIVRHILNRLTQEGHIVEDAISPNFLVRNWPPALPEWSTKSIRDAFFASPQLPKLNNPESIRTTIAKGVADGTFAYAEKTPGGDFTNVRIAEKMFESDVEISDDVFLLQKEIGLALKQGIPPPPSLGGETPGGNFPPESTQVKPLEGEKTSPKISKLKWEGGLAPQKWMTFYTKVLSRFPLNDELKLTIKVEVGSKLVFQPKRLRKRNRHLRS